MAHVPVLFNEVMEMAGQITIPVKRILDGTLGRGGHLRGLLTKFENASAVAIDRDHEAIEHGKTLFSPEIASERLRLLRSNYTDFDSEELGFFDIALLDLGVSSPQLDQAHRGFSFMHEGPLDMRMDQRQELTAAEIINTWDEEDLVELFKTLGEIRRPERVVKALVHDRRDEPFKTTTQLGSLVARVDGWRKKGHHPATQYFLALRLAVNHELQDVERGVAGLMRSLNPGGRLLVITFHSLEDRIVKELFKNNPDLGKPVNKKVVKPTWNEQKKNSRARSAQLRGFERNPI